MEIAWKATFLQSLKHFTIVAAAIGRAEKSKCFNSWLTLEIHCNWGSLQKLPEGEGVQAESFQLELIHLAVQRTSMQKSNT